MIASKTCADGNPPDPAVLTAKGQVVESQVIRYFSVFVPFPSGKSSDIGLTQGFCQPPRMEKLSPPMSAAVLQQNRQLCQIVDVRIQTVSEDGQTLTPVRFDGPHDGRMKDANGLEDLCEHKIPDVSIRILFALGDTTNLKLQSLQPNYFKMPFVAIFI